jgi:hypothetical protein
MSQSPKPPNDDQRPDDAALVPVPRHLLAAVPDVHAHALTRVLMTYETALATAHGATTQAEQGVADTVAATQAVADEAHAEYTRAFDTKAGDLLNPPDRRQGPDDPAAARCLCGKALARPGYCSKACADAALTEAAQQSGDRVLQDTEGPLWILTKDQSQAAPMLEAERDAHGALLRARAIEAKAAARLALAQSGKSRSELREDVAARQRELAAAQATRRQARARAEDKAKCTYYVGRMEWAEQQAVINQCLGDDYWTADAAVKRAEQAYDAAFEIWLDLLHAERDVRAVPPPPAMCTYCGLVEVTPDPAEPDKQQCSEGCRRAARRDGLTEPLPGCRQCAVCWRWFRNRSNAAFEYCSLRCLLSQPVDIEPWLQPGVVDFDQSVLLDVPKSPAERRKFGRLLLAQEREARTTTATPTGPEVRPPALPEPATLALPSPPERMRAAILARLGEHPAGLPTKPLLRGLGRYVAAAAELAALVAEGQVVIETGGRTGTAKVYRLAPPQA